MSEKSQMQKFVQVMGLALGLPGTIVGLFFVLNGLVSKGVISWNTLLIVLLVVVVSMLGLMVRYVLDRKNRR